MVAGDSTKTDRHKMPKEFILLNPRLPDGQKGSHDNE